MSLTLNTLVEDIYKLLDRGVSFTPDPLKLAGMTTNMAKHLTSALASRQGAREIGKVWFSDLGETCDRKTWYKWYATNKENLGGNTSFKFLYGNLLEEQVLYLAKEAGHSVEREQERIEYKHTNGWTISGRIDAIIDGVLVDVKSCSSYAYKKFTTQGINTTTDSFGYRAQISGYNNLLPAFSKENSTKPTFALVDKQNGNIALVPVEPLSKQDTLSDIDHIGKVVEQVSSNPLMRGYNDVPEGKSGNMKLGIACSYCPYKWECWPGLKGYAYSTGPMFLTKVVRPPNVFEIEPK